MAVKRAQAVARLQPGTLNGRTPVGASRRVPGGAVPKVGAGEVVFVAPTVALRCKLGASSATLQGGVGGWEDVPRPGREDGVQWTGTPAVRLDVPILLDGLAQRRSVEGEVAVLMLMGRPADGSPRGTPPPIVRVGGMVPHGGREWVISAVDWGDAVWDGQVRIRQWATITLTVFESLAVAKVKPRKSTQRPATRTITVKRGQTLASIARDELGAKTGTAVAAGVAVLKKLNGIRDPKAIKAGTKLRVPR